MIDSLATSAHMLLSPIPAKSGRHCTLLAGHLQLAGPCFCSSLSAHAPYHPRLLLRRLPTHLHAQLLPAVPARRTTHPYSFLCSALNLSSYAKDSSRDRDCRASP